MSQISNESIQQAEAANTAAAQEIVAELKARGVDQEMADEIDVMVIDLYENLGASEANQESEDKADATIESFAATASAVNNDGLDEQIRILVHYCGADEVRKRLLGTAPTPR